MVREAISIKQLRACGLSVARCHLVPDVAFSYQSASIESALDWLRSYEVRKDNKPLLGMTVINWGAQDSSFRSQDDYESACAAAARFFVENMHGKVFFFPQVWGPLEAQDDRVAARRVVQRLNDVTESIFLVEEPLPPDLLKSIYGLMDVFIGTRMHSNIFALSQNVPVIAISYQPKTQGIAEMVGIGDWCVNITEVTPQMLVEKLQSLWESRSQVHVQLAQTIPLLVKRAEQAAIIVAADFFNNINK